MADSSAWPRGRELDQRPVPHQLDYPALVRLHRGRHEIAVEPVERLQERLRTTLHHAAVTNHIERQDCREARVGS